MKNKVFEIIKEHNLIKKDDNIVIGLSGGPDSMALLYVLLEIKRELDFNIHIVHINHGVRGDDSDSDQLFVKRKAEELSLPYYTKNVDMVRYGKDHGISAEEAGRKLRYGFFREVLGKVGRGKIAVAQNMNDQAETLIMRFLRGTGVDGLKGMEYIVGDIIRPILGISREEIENYIANNGIDTVLDKTNLMPIYTRNKIRLELIPYIEENFNPNIINTLWRTSRISAGDSNFLEKYSKERYTDIVMKEDKAYIALNSEKFLMEDRSIQQRIIRNAILKLDGSLQGISEIQVASVLNMFLTDQTGKEFHLSNNIIARTSYERLILEKANNNFNKDFSYNIKMKDITDFKELGTSIELRILTGEDVNNLKKDKNIKYFDLKMVKGNLRLRNRKPGDRFIPFGMKGTKKIKDYFIDEKIPKELRDSIPLIVDDENILWVVGYRTNEVYKVKGETKSVLEIKYNQDNIKNKEGYDERYN